MAFDIAGNVVLISGAAGDIGSEICRGFAAEGARLVVADVDLSAAEALAKKLGDCAEALELDITDHASVENAARFVLDGYGRLDTLVNVAGILCRKSVFDTEKSDFETSMSVNVIGTFDLSKAMIDLLIKSPHGSIINISSLNGSAAAENRVVYGATKAALNMVTKSMALELGELGVTVNSVAPGVVDSRMCRVRLDTEEKVSAFAHYIPLGRLTQPSDVCGSVLFLSSPYARGITGAVLLVDGGIIARQALPR